MNLHQFHHPINNNNKHFSMLQQKNALFAGSTVSVRVCFFVSSRQQVARFLDCQTFYREPELSVLLRAWLPQSWYFVGRFESGIVAFVVLE